MCTNVYNYEGHLYDETLRNVNPYSTELTSVQKFAILSECRKNYRYFINTLIFKGKEDSILYKWQVDLLNNLDTKPMHVVVKRGVKS